MKHVIIGAGAAGIAAAKTIRGLHNNDEITIISTDEGICSRCMLHKYIGGERTEQELSFVEDNFFAENNITWKKGATVQAIDTNAKVVKLTGETISYDKLLLATGANSAVPPIGALRTANNVYGLRHLSDAKTISNKLDSVTKVVVIGAGLVGLDAAYALAKKGKQVSIVEMAPQILPLNLDEKAAGAYQHLFEQNGCEFYLNTKVTDTLTNTNGSVTHVVLENGTQLACDMVIVAAGVRPAVDYLQESGIQVERAVQVNPCMQTNNPDVYAAGDITGIGEIWPGAVRQGEVAGKNMCGEHEEFADRFALKNTINFFGLTTLSVGDARQKSDDGDIVKTREDRKHYQKVITDGTRIKGIILQGDISNSGIWQYLVKNKVDVSKVNKSVWNLTFADFYGSDTQGAYHWNA